MSLIKLFLLLKPFLIIADKGRIQSNFVHGRGIWTAGVQRFTIWRIQELSCQKLL